MIRYKNLFTITLFSTLSFQSTSFANRPTDNPDNEQTIVGDGKDEPRKRAITLSSQTATPTGTTEPRPLARPDLITPPAPNTKPPGGHHAPRVGSIEALIPNVLMQNESPPPREIPVDRGDGIRRVNPPPLRPPTRDHPDKDATTVWWPPKPAPGSDPHASDEEVKASNNRVNPLTGRALSARKSLTTHASDRAIDVAQREKLSTLAKLLGNENAATAILTEKGSEFAKTQELIQHLAVSQIAARSAQSSGGIAKALSLFAENGGKLSQLRFAPAKSGAIIAASTLAVIALTSNTAMAITSDPKGERLNVTLVDTQQGQSLDTLIIE